MILTELFDFFEPVSFSYAVKKKKNISGSDQEHVTSDPGIVSPVGFLIQYLDKFSTFSFSRVFSLKKYIYKNYFHDD